MKNLFDMLQEQWICPINKTAIRQPFLTVDGHTYEKDAIQFWLSSSNKSPKTGLQLQSKRLVSNHALKNLRDKISKIIPQNFQKIDLLQQQNENLKDQIRTLKEQFQHFKEKLEEESQICKKQRKIKKMQEKLKQSKNDQIKQLRIRINKLQGQTRQLTAKQSQLKAQQERIHQQYSSKISNMQIKQKKSLQQCNKQFKKVKETFVKALNDLQLRTNRYIKLIYIIIGAMVKLSKDQRSEEVKQVIQKIQDQCRQNFEKIQQNDTKFLYQDQYDMIKKIIINLKINCSNLSQIDYDLGAYVHSNKEFYGNYNKCSLKLFKSLMTRSKLWDGIDTECIESIENGSEQQIGDSEWKEVIKHGSKLQRLKSLVFINCNIKNVDKKDLQKIKGLKYVNLMGNSLTRGSLLSLSAYQSQNPEVSVLVDESRSVDNFDSDSQQTSGNIVLQNEQLEGSWLFYL